MTRNTQKEIIIKDRKFILKKYDPFFGNYIALQVFGSIFNKEGGLSISNLMTNFIGGKSPEDLKRLQMEVLNYCKEQLAEEIDIIAKDGSFRAINIDSTIVMNLFLNSIIYNMTDFLDSEVIEGFVRSLSEATQSLTKGLDLSPQKS